MQLTEVTEATRIAQCIEVLRLIQGGYPVVKACDTIGITPRQYRFWLAKGEDVILQMREVIAENERQELSIIAAAKLKTTVKLAEALEQPISVRDLVEIDKHLTLRQRELEERYGAQGAGDTGAGEFLLSGPKTRRAPSRLTVNIKAQSDGSLDISMPANENIVDAEFTESEE